MKINIKKNIAQIILFCLLRSILIQIYVSISTIIFNFMIYKDYSKFLAYFQLQKISTKIIIIIIKNHLNFKNINKKLFILQMIISKTFISKSYQRSYSISLIVCMKGCHPLGNR